MQANMTIDPRQMPVEAKPRELAESLEGTCVTVYLAGHKAGSGSRPMRVRLRAIVTEAEQLLERRGVLPTDRESLLEPLRECMASPELDSGHANGVAFLRTTRRFETVDLPWEVEDLVVVDGYPRLTPMVRGLAGHREFLLLAVSKKHTRLLDCGPSYHHPIELPAGLPQGLEAFEGFDKPEQSRGHASGVTFAHDTYAEKEKLYLHDFCRALERGLQPLFEKRGLPLVLAGATSELAAYRETNRYPLLAAHAVEGSPDGGATDAELAEKGRAAIRGWQPVELLHAVDLYQRAGTGKKSVEIEEILRAAAAGRVLHLFVTGDPAESGDVDHILERVLPSGSPVGHDDNLANAAAVETWRHGGSVWQLDEPLDRAAVAAVFRW